MSESKTHERFKRRGLFIVMVGPDGSGKTTAGTALRDKLSDEYEPIRYYHWKARLIKQETVPTGPPRENPHGDPLRSRWGSVVFFLGHVVELVIAHWVKVVPVLLKGGFVLVDRYYYDFFVDPRRYRLQLPEGLVSAVYKFAPKPDMIFVYDAPPEILQSRKKEVSPEECARQRDGYRELAKTLHQAQLIDASQTADVVAERVLGYVLDRMKGGR